MKCNVWKPRRDLHWLDELRFSIKRFFVQSATENNHLLCYWPSSDQPLASITLSRISALNFEFSVLTFLRMMSCSTRIEKKLFDLKTYWLLWVQSMSNTITCVDWRFAINNSGISGLALTILNAKNQFKVAKYDKSCTVFSCRSIRTYGCVIKARCSESGAMGSIPAERWNSLLLFGHFVWHWARQCTDMCAFIFLYSLYIFLVEFR